MDAKVDDWVVTPRIGKPVEINALWYNALETMAALRDIIDRLEPEFRIVFLLRDFEELSTKRLLKRWVSQCLRSNQDCYGQG
jgi:glycogen debranching enzyme